MGAAKASNSSCRLATAVSFAESVRNSDTCKYGKANGKRRTGIQIGEMAYGGDENVMGDIFRVRIPVAEKVNASLVEFVP